MLRIVQYNYEDTMSFLYSLFIFPTFQPNRILAHLLCLAFPEALHWIMHSNTSPTQLLLKSMLDLQLSMLPHLQLRKLLFYCPIPKHYFHFLHTVTLYFPLHVWIYNCLAETKPLGTYPYLFTVSPPELSKPPPICTSCPKSLNHLNFTTLWFSSLWEQQF